MSTTATRTHRIAQRLALGLSVTVARLDRELAEIADWTTSAPAALVPSLHRSTATREATRARALDMMREAMAL